MVGAGGPMRLRFNECRVAQSQPDPCSDLSRWGAGFHDSSKVGKAYTEVAVLNSKGDNDMTSESGMINSQRKKAAQLGANGVILGSMADPGTGAKVFHALIGTSANRKGKSIAIYIPADTARVAAACKATH